MFARRILVVEDDFDLAEVARLLLEDLGYVVIGPARTNQAALSLMHSGPIDGAIVDLQLGRRPAYPVLDALLAQQTPVVILSGRDEAESLPPRYAAIKRCRKPTSVIDAVDLLFA